MEEESNSYSKVVYKKSDDKEAQKMVNSYRFKSPSPSRYKVWSPGISKEERFKKKREREDEYINQFNPKDRPVLVIKKKNAYKNINKINVLNEAEKESYYKISENTNIVENVQEELKAQENFIRKNTKIYNKPFVNENDETSLYKIEGIEFLPEGFLELDPLLHKDEFEFESKIHEKFFTDEQRKIKALRRKQYQQKNNNKMRDVTIFLVDEKRDKIIEFLENWYFKHKRRMNQNEIEYVSDLLNCDRNTMKDLQDMFLEKKKYLNTKNLREYLTKHGRIQNDKMMVPSSLKQYFIKTKKNQYSHVSPRVFNIDYSPNKNKKIESSKTNKTLSMKKLGKIKTFKEQIPSSETFINNDFKNYNKNKVMSDNVNKFSYTNQITNSYNYPEQQISNVTPNSLHPQILKDNLFSNTSDNYQINTSSDYKKSGFSTKKSFGLIKTSTQEDSSSYYRNQEEYDDLRIYFDSEVNKILDKIRGSDYSEDCNVDIGAEKKIMNCKYVIDKNINSQTLVNDYTNKLINDKKINSDKFIKKESNAHVRKKTKKSLLDEIAYDVLNEENLRPDLKITNELLRKSTNKSVRKTSNELERKSTKNNKGEIVEKIEHYPEMDTFGGDKQPKASTKILYSEVDELGNIQVREDNLDKVLDSQNNPKRVTFMAKNSKGDTKIVQKLEPILVGHEYFYQSIVDTVTNNERKVTLITKNDRGEIINNVDIDPEDRTDNYQNEVYDEFTKFDGDKKLTVVVNNNRGKMISIQSLRPTLSCIKTDNTLENQLYEGNFRKSTISIVKHSEGIKKIHSLNPILVDGMNYHQKIIEDTRNGERKITINTIDDKGKLIYEEELEDVGQSKSFFTQIENDFINEDGDRETTIVTKNNIGESLVSHTIKTKISSQNEEYFSKLNRGYRFTTMNVKKVKDETIRAHTLKPIVVGMDYFHQSVEERVDKNGKRTLSIITKDQLGHIIKSEQTDKNLIGMGYYNEVIEDTIEKDGKRKITIATKNDRGETIAIKSLRPTINSVLGELFYDDFIEKSRGKSCISKKSVVQNKKITVHALKPTIMGNQYYQQIIEEVEDSQRNKKTTLITKNQEGQIVSKVDIDSELIKGNDFLTEIIKAEVDNSGHQILTVSTKNEKGEEIACQKIKPTIFNILGDNYFEEFETKSQGRGSVMNSLKHKGSIIRCQTLRPTKVGNKTYQSIINEVIDEEGNKTAVVMTRNEKGELIDVNEIDPKLKIGTYCYADLENKAERGITIVIKNQEGQNISVQKVIDQDINKEENLEDFSNTVLSNFSFSTNKTNYRETNIHHSLKPTLIGDEYFQQIINEEVDLNGKKKITIITKKLDGEIVERKSINENLCGINYHTQITNDFLDDKGKRKVTLETRNDRGETIHLIKIEPQKLNKTKTLFNSKDIEELNKNNIEFLKNKDGSIIKKNTIRSTIIGNDLYKHVIEEIVFEGKKKMTLITLDLENKEIDRKEVNPSFSGENYYAQVVEENLGKDGRVATLEIVNEKNQILASQKFICETATNQQDYYFTDFVDIFDSTGKRSSTIAIKNKRKTTFKTHSLKPNLVGNTYYRQSVNELIEEDKKIGVIVTSDENGNIITTQKLPEELMGEYYTNQIREDTVDENGERLIIFEMKNDRGETISVKSFRPSINQFLEDGDYNEYLEEIIDVEGNKMIHFFEIPQDKKPKLTQRNITKFRKTILTPIMEENEEDSTDENEPRDQKKKTKKTKIDRNKYFETLIEKYGIINKTRGYSEVVPKNKKFTKSNTINVKDYKKDSPVIYKIEVEEKDEIDHMNQATLDVHSVKREKTPTMRPSNKSITKKSIKKPKNISGRKLNDQKGKKKEVKKVSVPSTKVLKEEENRKNSNAIENSKEEDQNKKNSKIIENPENSKIDKFEKEESIKDSNIIEDEHESSYDQNNVLKKLSDYYEKIDNNIKKSTENTNSFFKKEKVIQKEDQLEKINRMYSEIKKNSNIKESEFLEEIEQNNDGDDVDGEQMILIEKSKRLKGYLDDYINTINTSKMKQERKTKKKGEENDIMLRKTIEEVFNREKEKLSDEITDKLKKEIKKNSSIADGDLMNEFYLFCRNTLPQDQKYKESIMFVSLFYYFLEKKKIIN